MLVDYCVMLGELLAKYHDESGRTERAEVLFALVGCVAENMAWYVPVEIVPEEAEEPNLSGFIPLKEIPVFTRKTVVTKNGMRLTCAFTECNDVHPEKNDGFLMTVKYPARQLLEEYLQEETSEGFLLNPWADEFFIDRGDAAQILLLADKATPELLRADYRYRCEPCAVIDANAILSGWREGWKDNGHDSEPWELIAYPIMADGQILLLFELKSEIYAGKYDSFHVDATHSHFRVLAYRLVDGVLRETGRYRFAAQCCELATVFLRDGVLSALIRSRGSSSYHLLQMIPTDDDAQFLAFAYPTRAAMKSDGTLAVSYGRNQSDKERIPLLTFGSGGEELGKYRDSKALACRDLNLDAAEHIWFAMYPAAFLHEAKDSGLTEIVTHRVALQGFDCFALSDDHSRLFASFSETDGGTAQYILSQDENGDYVDPIPFEFCPKDGDGKPLKSENAASPSRVSAMKSLVLLESDGRLYLYDVNDCCEEDMKDA